MGSTNRTQIGIIEETTPGTTPTSPEFELIRTTGSPDLAFNPTVVTSDEIRADRNVADTILVGAEATGSINFELSYDSMDRLLRSAMFSAWINTPGRIKTSAGSEVGAVTATTYAVEIVAGQAFVEGHLIRAKGFTETANNKLFRADSGTTTSSIVTTGNTIEATPPVDASLKAIGYQGETGDIEATTTSGNALISNGAVDFTTFIAVGMWIKIGNANVTDSSFATALLNDWVRVSEVAALRLDLDVVPTGWTDDDGTGKDIILQFGDYIRNGVTEQSWTLERSYLDLVPVLREYFRGMYSDVFAITASSQSIITGETSFSGFTSELTETRVSGATEVAQGISNVFNSSSNVGRIAEDGIPISGENYVTEISMNISNNLAQKPAVGFLGAVGIRAGECAVTGTLNTYFDSPVLVQKVINNTETSLDFRFADNDTQTMLFDMPRVKYTTGSPSVPGKNDDVTASLEYQAIYYEDFDCTVQVQRFSEVG